MKGTASVTWMPASIMKQLFSLSSRTIYSAGTFKCTAILSVLVLILQHCNDNSAVQQIFNPTSLSVAVLCSHIFVSIIKESIIIYLVVVTATIKAIL
jgi:hypothetical protein